MKFLTVLIAYICFSISLQAQNSDYSKLWQTVESYEIQGLPKSALKSLEPIIKKADQDNNSVQKIKIMLFKSKFLVLLEEDAQLKVIQAFKAEVAKQSVPTKNVLENILAKLYWEYFKTNRYRFYNRTNTAKKSDANDFRTWDLKTLFVEIQNHFNNSLQNGLILKQTPLRDFTSILKLSKHSKTYRPTLFDLLSNNALQFFKTSENAVTKPAYQFKIDTQTFLGTAQTFSKFKIVSKDTSSLQLQALKIYQELIAFHLKSKHPLALADVNISRLNYVNQQAVFQNKEIVLETTLKLEADALGNALAADLYNYGLASLYKKQGDLFFKTKTKSNQKKLQTAVEICKSILDKHPNSPIKSRCNYLIEKIKEPTLEIKTERFLPINSFEKVLVSYKNIEQLDFKAYHISESEFKRFSEVYRQEDKKKFISKLKATTQWQAQLKNENDYQRHTTEVLVPKLPNGRFLIVANAKKLKANFFAYTHVQVTNIALVEYNDSKTKFLQCINRNDGSPIVNARVEIQFYNWKKNLGTVYKTTDVDGKINIKKTKYKQLRIEVKTAEEQAYFGDYYIGNYYNIAPDENPRYKAFVFTDRSIYRPGQTVYFKAIAMKRIDKTSEVLANTDVYAALYNVNNEEVKSLKFITNAFGSITGEFVIPNSGLNGNYRIEFDAESGYIDLNGYASFSVEEYKRPKFEATFLPVTKTYKVNDSITVSGKALAYAGSVISNAKVVYKVKRNVHYPQWYYWYHPSFNGNSQEITFGETTTNNLGEFLISFKALPDTGVDKNNAPVFNYEITADVTDINGETHNVTTIVNVGYHALLATLQVAERLDKAIKNHKISIDTKNLNGEFVAANGQLKLYKLKAPNRVLRERSWPAPDYQAFSRQEFIQLFPHSAYKNEDQIIHREKGELVFEKSINTGKTKTIDIGNIKSWQSGQYLVVFETKDRFGQHISEQARTIVFNTIESKVSDNQLFTINSNKKMYAPHDEVLLTLGSAAKSIVVYVDVEKAHNIVKSYKLTLNTSKTEIKIPVTKDDLGGFSVSYSFSVFNRFYSGTLAIQVPHLKTDLEIETQTFRDKLQPSQNETWSFTIKGSKGDKVSAELLASMYDASLDQFKPHQWQFNPIQYSNYYSQYHKKAQHSFGTSNLRIHRDYSAPKYPKMQTYDALNWFGFSLTSRWVYSRYLNHLKAQRSTYDGIVEGQVTDVNGEPIPGVNIVVKGTSFGTQTDFDGGYTIKINKGDVLVFSFIGYKSKESSVNFKQYNVVLEEDENSLDEVVVTAYSAIRGKSSGLNAVAVQMDDEEVEETVLEEALAKELVEDKKTKATDFSQVKIRKNLQETAFFFPQLQTDKKGQVRFSFIAPEALTLWKLQLLAHTKTLESAKKTLEIVTQKELMVLPNAPRFLREGDSITLSTKIANLTKKSLSGNAVLQVFDAVSGKSIDIDLQIKNTVQSFLVNAKGNTQVSWHLQIPEGIQAVQYKIIAKTKAYSDGEQSALPVLSNRMLVTETLPMWIKSNTTKTFTLDKLKNNASTSLKHHKLTLEITSNPAWYAIQALPYLMEYPYQCNEQTFSRYYANALASHIVNSNPRIESVFKQWKNSDALVSSLEKNQDLKSILIQETPWLRDAQSETEQKKRIALLFDLNKMTYELNTAIQKLKSNQMGSGAWSWFKGGRANRYITQHIITGFGHLKKLKVNTSSENTERMIKNAISYLDTQFIKEYNDITKYNTKVDLSKNHLSYTQLHYLYMRSLFPQIKQSRKVKAIINYYQSQIKHYWLSRNLYAKGLMALILQRLNDTATAKKILKSLKENSITSDELGMYWKENTSSWYWYQAPIETQALLIEAFSEIENDTATIDNLKMWLLKNKQTNKWSTTKATTDAVYALLLQGSDWLSVTDAVAIVLGEKKIDPKNLDAVKVEAGTGYFKTTWKGTEIQPKMAEVKLTKTGKGIAWGSLYWQYFEDLDKITSAETPLKIKKQLFLKQNTDHGEQLKGIDQSTKLKVGDLVRVRIELRSDRAMEFVHMKDMRAAGFEPSNVLSRYKWQDGLGYYESTKDASTNFFFDYLPKGVFVFEYDLRVNNSGQMSNGITIIQSMYAPEFSSHSKGARVFVD